MIAFGTHDFPHNGYSARCLTCGRRYGDVHTPLIACDGTLVTETQKSRPEVSPEARTHVERI